VYVQDLGPVYYFDCGPRGQAYRIWAGLVVQREGGPCAKLPEPIHGWHTMRACRPAKGADRIPTQEARLGICGGSSQGVIAAGGDSGGPFFGRGSGTNWPALLF